MPEKQTWTCEELYQLLLAYDVEYGSYPEHIYEGLAVWQHLMTGNGYVTVEQGKARQAECEPAPVTP